MKAWKILACFILGVAFLNSCVKDSLEPTVDPPNQNNDAPIEDVIPGMNELDIPQGFDFNTEKEVDLTITDSENGVRYVVLVKGNEVANRLIMDGGISVNLKVPTAVQEVKILRRTAYTYSEFKMPITGNSISFEHSN